MWPTLLIIWVLCVTKAIAQTTCAPGTYNATGTCTPCPAGTISTAMNATGCFSCGTLTPTNPPVACLTCSAGTGTDGNGNCVPCQPGAYAAVGDGICTNCPLGKFSSDNSSSHCDDCPKGSYTHSQGLSTCADCAAGFYASTRGTITCSPCTTGTFSTPGSTVCLACPFPTTSAAQASSCTSCPDGFYLPATGTPTCTACPVISDNLSNLEWAQCLPTIFGGPLTPTEIYALAHRDVGYSTSAFWSVAGFLMLSVLVGICTWFVYIGNAEQTRRDTSSNWTSAKPRLSPFKTRRCPKRRP